MTVSGANIALTFVAGPHPFKVIPQQKAQFSQYPSGNPVVLAGTNGARILLTGFRVDQANYKGPKKLTSSGPRLLEVAELGDFEGEVNLGVGLSDQACANVTSTGSVLTFHFIQDT